jgi:hypothetical protein
MRCARKHELPDLAAAAQPFADQVERHPGDLPRPPGRIKSVHFDDEPGLCRTAPKYSTPICFCPEGVGVGLPTIWREAAVTTGHAVYQEA